ncbi:MAG: TetR family transcriptional regulator [Xanthobacter sp.]
MARSTALDAAAKRKQILQAAILRFARQSYEDTTLRAIAADVDVDVAHVHRSFGSKENLLMAAVLATAQPQRFRSETRQGFVTKLVDEIFERDTGRADEEVGSLDIFMRSLTSREAAHVMHDGLLTELIVPFAEMLDPPSTQRAALMVAVLVGIGVLRDVLGIEPLREKGDGELRRLIIEMLEQLIGDDPPVTKHEAGRSGDA